MSDNSQESFNFVPYDPHEERRNTHVGPGPGRHPYTPEEDQRILEALAMADEAGIPRSPVWSKLAEEFGRSPKAIEIHFYQLRKSLNGDEDEEERDDEDTTTDTSIFERLKTLVKERDYYKSKYDSMQGDYGSIKAENEKLSKEMKQIRRLLGS